MGRIWQLPQEQDELDGTGDYECTCLPRYDDDGRSIDYYSDRTAGCPVHGDEE